MTTATEVSTIVELNPTEATTDPEGDVESTLGSEDEGERKQQRRYTTLELVEGYSTPQAFVVYVNGAASEAGYKLLDIVELLKKHAAKTNPDGIVIDTTQSFGKVLGEDGKPVKGPDGRALKGELLATRVYIDTPASQAAAKRNGRAAVKAPKPAQEQDLPKILRAMNAMKLDEEFLTEAKALGRDVTELARERACEKYHVSVETLQAWFARMIGA